MMKAILVDHSIGSHVYPEGVVPDWPLNNYGNITLSPIPLTRHPAPQPRN